jgi:hypothetical protein
VKRTSIFNKNGQALLQRPASVTMGCRDPASRRCSRALAVLRSLLNGQHLTPAALSQTVSAIFLSLNCAPFTGATLITDARLSVINPGKEAVQQQRAALSVILRCCRAAFPAAALKSSLCVCQMREVAMGQPYPKLRDEIPFRQRAVARFSRRNRWRWPQLRP